MIFIPVKEEIVYSFVNCLYILLSMIQRKALAHMLRPVISINASVVLVMSMSLSVGMWIPKSADFSVSQGHNFC